ncbi:MAG: hypothetical protein ACQET2_14285 [Pseudomonadota bacterium]
MTAPSRSAEPLRIDLKNGNWIYLYPDGRKGVFISEDGTDNWGAPPTTRTAHLTRGGLKKTRTREYDRDRHVFQPPLSRTKRCVMYLANGRERRSPWFYTPRIAQRALEAMKRKYGQRNAILLLD